MLVQHIMKAEGFEHLADNASRCVWTKAPVFSGSSSSINTRNPYSTQLEFSTKTLDEGLRDYRTLIPSY